MSASQDFKQMAISFISTLESRIEALETHLLMIEARKEDPEKLYRIIISEIHSIKGNAAAFQLNFLKSIGHNFEDVLTEHQADIYANKTIDLLLLHCDIIKEYIRDNHDANSEKDEIFFERYKSIIGKNGLGKAEVNIPLSESTELKILTVGIPSSIYKSLLFGLSQFSVQSTHLKTASAAIEQISQETYDIIVASYVLSPIDGLTLSMVAKNILKNSRTKFVLLPSQEINASSFSTDPNLVPDKIIYKDLEMNKIFAEYCLSIYGNKNITKIAFIDDEEPILDLYKSIVQDSNIECLFLNGSEDIFSELKTFAPTLIISDINIPNIRVDLMKSKIEAMFGKNEKKLKFIFFTGDPDTAFCKKMRELGAEVFDKSNLTEILFPLIESAEASLPKKS